MKSSRLWLVAALLIAGASLPIRANASDACADMFDRFADQLDKIADSYDRMKADREVCAFARETEIPTHKRILAEVEVNWKKCDNGPGALAMAREQLEHVVNHTNEICKRAGM